MPSLRPTGNIDGFTLPAYGFLYCAGILSVSARALGQNVRQIQTMRVMQSMLSL
jgi:hypothetical protein